MLNDLVILVADQGVLAFAIALVVLQTLAKEIGYAFGHRTAARQENPGEGVGIVVGGMLALLAFVLALTLSFSSARFQERRVGTLAEANAIGTAWLQARAIGHTGGAEIATLLEEYALQRRAYVQADYHSQVLAETTQRTNALQSAIWGHVTAIVRDRPDAATVSLMNAVNTTFDMSTTTRFAFASVLPPQLFWLLVGMTAVSMAALGFQLGLRQKPLRMLTLLLLCMWTATTTVILDMGSARMGNVRVGTQAFDWTIQGFQPGPPAAPR